MLPIETRMSACAFMLSLDFVLIDKRPESWLEQVFCRKCNEHS